MKRNAITMLVLLFCAIGAVAGTKHAPPPELMAARTIYIENNSKAAVLADGCYDELTKWGQFQIVSDPKQADLIFQISSHVQTYVYSAPTHTSVTCDAHRHSL